MNLSSNLVVWAKAWVLGAIAVALLACDGGGKTAAAAGSVPTVQQSPVLVSLTDAEGDFLEYQVAVSSIELQRENQSMVSVLSRSATVDFAQYVDVSELLTALDVPSGRYTSMRLNLDFSGASILVQSDSGEAIPAMPVDQNGAVLKHTALTIQFSDQGGLVLLPGVPTHLALDFDLDSSNQVEFTPGGATVVVSPVIFAETVLSAPKPMRMRGFMTAVDATANRIDISLRPFRLRRTAMGAGHIYVNNETQFEIDGEFLAIDQALQRLAELDGSVPLVAKGNWQAEQRRYLATQVTAGTSLAWGQKDLVTGTVVARNGLDVILRGASAELKNGLFAFKPNLAVHLGDSMDVRLYGRGEGSLADIAVGSLLTVSGEMSLTGLNAQEGFARIYPSSLSGTIVSESPLAVDVQFMNGVRVKVFENPVLENQPETNTELNFYRIDTQSLPLAHAKLGDPVRLLGWVQAQGNGNQVDFMASTLMDHADIDGHLTITFEQGAENPALLEVSSDGLLWNIEAATQQHRVRRAGITTDLGLENSPVWLNSHAERGAYVLARSGQYRLYTQFADFVAAVNALVAQDVAVLRVDAHGDYNDTLRQFTSQRLRIVMAD